MSDIKVNIPGECLYDKVFVLSFIIYNISINLNIVNGIFYIQAKKDSITFEWKAKEQTRKLAIDSSKPVDIVKGNKNRTNRSGQSNRFLTMF
ncbi:hypothetical protein [Streptococcus pneumoniae]|uniref:hypothetical protein n=1 Tax=Streptococcus pneumoniae TaxID=1313 RepID=UPI00067B37DB|nr:hypothetical protein [Streptococcus pneumoniae]